MTVASVDIRVAPPATAEEITPPQDPIPDVVSLGSREILKRKTEAELRDKFAEYAEAAPKLVDHHEYQRARFDQAYANYVRIFTGLETLEKINSTAEAVAPGFNLLEEFELIDIPEGWAKAAAVTGTVALYGGGAKAIGDFFVALKKLKASQNALKTAQGTAATRARSPSFIKGAKSARNWKIAGALGAVLTVGTATVGVIATIENTKRRMAFLRDSVQSYDIWYTQTKQNVGELQGAADEMEGAISELMDLLGSGSTAELISFLGGALDVAGQVQGALKTATRMLCAEDPMDEAVIASLTGLPVATITRRALLIKGNPTICTLAG